MIARVMFPNGLGLILVVLLVSSSPGTPPLPLPGGDAPNKPVEVDIVVVKRGTLRQVDRTAGRIEAETVVPIQARLGGYVENIDVETGDAVKKGQTLVTISAPDLIAAREALNARLNLAEIERTRAESVLRQTRERTLGTALELAEADFQAATARREVARAEIRKADVDLSSLRLVSPIDGLVTTRNVAIGQLAAPGGPPLLVVSKLDTVRLRAMYPSTVGLRLRPGDPVKVWGGIGPPVDARVGRVGVTADPATGAIPVDFFLKNDDKRWCPGLSALIESETRSKPNCLLIPVEGVWQGQDGPACFKVVNGRVQRVAVKLDDTNEDGRTREVSSGLAEGDVLVKRPQSLFAPDAPLSLVDGSPVHIKTSTRPPESSSPGTSK